MRSYTVKENHISSAATEIFRYTNLDKQADNHRSCYFIIRNHLESRMRTAGGMEQILTYILRCKD